MMEAPGTPALTEIIEEDAIDRLLGEIEQIKAMPLRTSETPQEASERENDTRVMLPLTEAIRSTLRGESATEADQKLHSLVSNTGRAFIESLEMFFGGVEISDEAQATIAGLRQIVQEISEV